MLTRGELVRQLGHVGLGAGAFALRFLGPVAAALLALAAALFNLLVLPRLGGRLLWRREEVSRGRSAGIVLYPVAVLVLVLAFHRRLEVAAAVWGILAFGDGAATLAGTAWGRRRLPWNPRKSWVGSAAHLVCGTAAAAALLAWTAPGRYPFAFVLAAAAAAALLAAALESLSHGLDDNLGVPLVTGLFLFCVLLTATTGAEWLADPALPARLAAGLAVSGAFAGLAWLARALDRSGAAAGLAVGVAVWVGLGWRGFLLLFLFVALGSGVTRLGYEHKRAERLAQEAGGRRSARHALANGSVAAACALFAAATPHPGLFTVAFAGALATAAADTAGSEVGQLWGRRTFLVTTLRPVPRGTGGAISLEGTLAGVLAAALVAAAGAAAGLFGWRGAAVVLLAATLGSLLESVAGATVERGGLLGNEAVNFLNTLAGALLAAGLAAQLA